MSLDVLESAPISKIADTQVIYSSGKISNYGTTICESEKPLKLQLEDAPLGTSKKIFSTTNCSIILSNGTLELTSLHNFVEFIFTHLGWQPLNNILELKSNVLYEAKDLTNTKIDGNYFCIYLWSSSEIIILRNGNVKKLTFAGIKKCEIRNDWIYILTDKLQYYDITFDKLSDFPILVTDFIIGNLKNTILVQNKNWKLYTYGAFNWNFVLEVDQTYNIFNFEEVMLARIEGDTLIEKSLTLKTRSVKLSGPILDIAQCNSHILILFILDGVLKLKLNFGTEYNLISEYKDTQNAKIVDYNSEFLHLLVGDTFKIFKLQSEFIPVFEMSLKPGQKYISGNIYTLCEDKLSVQKLY